MISKEKVEKIKAAVKALNPNFECDHDMGDSVVNHPEAIGVFYPSGMTFCEFINDHHMGVPTQRWVVESYNQLNLKEIVFVQQCLEILDGVAA